MAGGTGSRLYPITKVINKHLLLVYNKPMIYYPLETLAKAGVKDVIIVSGKEHILQFQSLLSGNGDFKNINFAYAVQKEAGGIAQALGVCKEFVGEEKIVAMLGDNVIIDDIKAAVSGFESGKIAAEVFLKSTKEPSKYTIAKIVSDKMVGLEDKPFSPKSDLALSGLYMFDSSVWRVISQIRPSVKGELEIIDVITYFLKNNKLEYKILERNWFDIDTFRDLLAASNFFAGK